MARPTYEEWKLMKGDSLRSMNDPIQEYILDTTVGSQLAKKLNKMFPKKDYPRLEKISPLKSGVHFLIWFYGITFILIIIAMG